MNEAAQTWLKGQAEVDGVLACGLWFPDGSTLTQSRAPNFPPEALENVWRCLNDAFQVFHHHHLNALQLRWFYEDCLVHCVCGEGGRFLAVLTPRRGYDAGAVERLLERFRSASREFH